ncbi:RluA family pseudouridine synthase [Lachnospiraceae bacterium LCP25S3_G4]
MNMNTCNILYEDNHIIVCHKKAGIATQSGHIGTPDMVSILKNYLSHNPQIKGEPYLAVIHRLDQPVEGLLVFGKTPFAAKALNQQLQTYGFGKYYYAQLCSMPPNPSGHLEHYMVKNTRTNASHICNQDTPGAKKAILDYEVVESSDTPLVKIQLQTGRHHQIRVQMSYLGCPILGDTKYNASVQTTTNWTPIRLCAYHLIFKHPKTQREMAFTLENPWS